MTLTPAAVEPGVTRLDGLRVAMVNWREPAQREAGGAEEYAWRMSLGLRERGARVHYLTSREPGQRAREVRSGVHLVRLGGTYSRYALVAGWLARHRGAFDAVIDCMNGVPFFSPLAVGPRTRIFLLVHHVHSDQFPLYFDPVRAAVGRAVEGRVTPRLYRNHPAIAVSPSTAVAMRDRLGWRGPIHVVPNGTTPLVATSARRTGSPSLVYVGRLVRHKRVDLLIEAAATLRATFPDLALHIVGRGPEHARLAARVERLGLARQIRLHGFLPEDDKNALLAGADLHVTASAFEGWGLSVMEAASLGLPTVAPDIDGLRDAIRDGETGWLSPAGEAMADAVQRALEELADPVRKAAVAASCRSWSSGFTWSASADYLARLIVGASEKLAPMTPEAAR